MSDPCIAYYCRKDNILNRLTHFVQDLMMHFHFAPMDGTLQFLLSQCCGLYLCVDLLYTLCILRKRAMTSKTGATACRGVVFVNSIYMLTFNVHPNKKLPLVYIQARTLVFRFVGLPCLLITSVKWLQLSGVGSSCFAWLTLQLLLGSFILFIKYSSYVVLQALNFFTCLT